MGAAQHIACSLTSTLLSRVRRAGGDAAIERVLEAAASERSPGYLQEVTNWVSYDEAIALFAAAVEVTGDAGIARSAGEETVRQHAGTPVATLLRSMGSPEQILQGVTTTVTKFSVVTEMEALEVEPGRARVRASARPGFERNQYLCDWTAGLLSQPTVLFGLRPAIVEEVECQARGGSQCLYEVSWDAAEAAGAVDPEQHITALEAQLAAMGERVESILATAGELIAHDDLDTALARITERAATTVRAPRYLLAVRPTAGSELHCHHRGLTDREATEFAARLEDEQALPGGWLVAGVRSTLRDYGHLVAIHDPNAGFFAQEHELFAVYARYAATVLDRATALADVKRRQDEAQALLELSRALAAAGDTDDVAQRIVAAVPSVVDCDRAGLFLWDEAAGELRAPAGTDERLLSLRVRPEDTPHLRDMLTATDPAPLFWDETVDDPFLRGVLDALDDRAALVMPIAARGAFLGLLTVGVADRPERLSPTPELLDRLSAVAAQAATALQTGRLIDRITHQALHDGLTDLPNRELFHRRLEESLAAARGDDAPVALFYVDIDRFKEVNDAYGHAAGDALLREVAQRLVPLVRQGDTVARVGGDEFAVLLAGACAQEQIDAVAGRIVAAFEGPFLIEGERLRISASVGRAIWPADATELEGLLRTADADMYGVKRDRAASELAN